MLPRWRPAVRLCRRHLSSTPSGAAAAPVSAGFRTSVNDPSQHSMDDLGRLYTVDPEHHKRLFQVTGLRRQLAEQARTFRELALLVRRPALDIISCLRAADPARPPPRLLLYGHYGAGKSTTVAHLLHWAHAEGWITVHLPEADRWGFRYREVVASTADPLLIEQPADAAAWISHFRQQNAARLAELDLRTGREYTWSRREATAAGAPLSELLELGTARIKHASQAMVALLGELKRHATDQRCRLLVAVEKVNAFWGMTSLRREDRSVVPFSDLVPVRAVLPLLAADWSGGAVVTTVAPVPTHQADQPHRPPQQEEALHSHLPRHLLGKEGWRALDPFVPVRVDDMSRLETYTLIDYFCDRRWLQAGVSGTEEGKKELFFRSGGNPAKLVDLCRFY